MSFLIFQEDVLDLFLNKKVSAQEYVLIMVFKRLMKENNVETLSLTNDNLSKLTGFSERSIRAYIKNLEDIGIIYVDRECKIYSGSKGNVFFKSRYIRLNKYQQNQG